jgi:anti-anti-sigma regulatory factor
MDSKNLEEYKLYENIEDYYETFLLENYTKISKPPISFIIIDFSPVNYIDSVGVKTIQQVLI